MDVFRKPGPPGGIIIPSCLITYLYWNNSAMSGMKILWMHLRPDGSMTYAERLRRQGKPSQSLRETGCWQHDAGNGDLILRTLKSNGAWVEADDPIYVNRYSSVVQGSGQLRLGSGQSGFSLKRMPDDYRLPF